MLPLVLAPIKNPFGFQETEVGSLSACNSILLSFFSTSQTRISSKEAAEHIMPSETGLKSIRFTFFVWFL